MGAGIAVIEHALPEALELLVQNFLLLLPWPYKISVAKRITREVSEQSA